MVVLVVDSSVFIIERWQHILSEAEYITAVYGAVSYKDAARLFKEIKPDVVLLDNGLPGNMSVDLLNEFKATSADTPVIILANSIDHQMQVKYKSLGANFYFDKYNDFEKIPGIINNIVVDKIGQ